MNTAENLSVTELARIVLAQTPQLTRRQAIVASARFLEAKATA